MDNDSDNGNGNDNATLPGKMASHPQRCVAQLMLRN